MNEQKTQFCVLLSPMFTRDYGEGMKIMDEATPHLHIDFIPYTTGSKQGIETRVSLKRHLQNLDLKAAQRAKRSVTSG